jgi:hypothetical protein
MGLRPTLRIRGVDRAGRRVIPARTEQEEPEEHRRFRKARQNPPQQPRHAAGAALFRARDQIGRSRQFLHRTPPGGADRLAVRQAVPQHRLDEPDTVLRREPVVGGAAPRIRSDHCEPVAFAEHGLDAARFVPERMEEPLHGLVVDRLLTDRKVASAGGPEQQAAGGERPHLVEDALGRAVAVFVAVEPTCERRAVGVGHIGRAFHRFAGRGTLIQEAEKVSHGRTRRDDRPLGGISQEDEVVDFPCKARAAAVVAVP